MNLLADAKFTIPIDSPTTLEADAPSAASYISTILAFLTILGGIWFILWIIIAAFNWISAEGKPDKLEKARTSLIHAITGLVILIAAYAITGLIGSILGIDFFEFSQFVCMSTLIC